MYVQHPTRGSLAGSCNVIGLRWWASVSFACVCFPGLPALVSDCNCMPSHHVSLYLTLNRGAHTEGAEMLIVMALSARQENEDAWSAETNFEHSRNNN